MPRLLKDLQINDVSSVDKGAGIGVKVMLMKRAGQESDMQTLHTMVDDFMKVYKADRPHAYAAVMATPEGLAKYRAERDGRLSKSESKPMNSADHGGAEKLPDDEMTTAIRAYMRAHGVGYRQARKAVMNSREGVVARKQRDDRFAKAHAEERVARLGF